MTSQSLQAAQDLVPQIRALREETESNRLVAAPVVESLRRLGLGRMVVEQSLGGLEAPTVEALGVYEALAGAEASVAWIIWNNALPCMLSRFLPPHARAQILADPNSLYASSTRPSGKAVADDGGYRMSGRWSLVSGCELADWIAFLCLVEENGQLRALEPGSPELRILFVRRDDCQIIDTWHSGGLRGTGSHDVVVQDLFVEEAYAALPGAESSADGPVGRLPIFSTMAAGFAAQAMGLASVALATVLELAETKVSPAPRPDLRDLPANQAGVALHLAALTAARTHVHATAEQIWNKAVNAEQVTLNDNATAWSAAHHAVQVSRQVVDAMYAIGGTTSLYTHCPMERVHRDMHAMMRHVIAQQSWLENAGRVMFGLQPEEPLFAM